MKEIPGFEGFYACDELGNIYSLTRSIMRSNGAQQTFQGKKLKVRINKVGQMGIVLNKVGVRTTMDVHRIMGKTFLSVPDDMYIRHIDGNKRNNKLNNLEICTHSENVHKAIKLGLYDNVRGSKHYAYYITDDMYKKTKELLSTTDLYQREIAEIVGISRGAVSYIKLNKGSYARGDHYAFR